jgi:hypothetical protein
VCCYVYGILEIDWFQVLRLESGTVNRYIIDTELIKCIVELIRDWTDFKEEFDSGPNNNFCTDHNFIIFDDYTCISIFIFLPFLYSCNLLFGLIKDLSRFVLPTYLKKKTL